MKKTKSVFSMVSFAVALTSLSLSSLANAQIPAGELIRAAPPKYFEHKTDRPVHHDRADAIQKPGKWKQYEHKIHAKHAELKGFIDSLPEAERDYIKSEFKAIRDDRLANERRMDALKERLEMHRSEMGDKMTDRDGSRGGKSRHDRVEKRFHDQSGPCMMKGKNPETDNDQSHKELRERPKHRGYDGGDRYIKMEE